MSKHRVLKIALPLTSLAFLASQAYAGQWPVFDYIKLTPTGIPSTIIVESENNSTWTKVRPSQILLSGVVDIKMDKGNVSDFWITHGAKTVTPWDGEMVNGPSHLKEEISFKSSTSNLGIASIVAINACNAKLKTGAEIYKDQYIQITTDLTLHAYALTNSESLTREGYGSFPLTVKCLGIPIDIQPPKPQPPPVADVDDLKPGQKFKVRSAALGIHKPQSNVCPTTAQINARFETNFDGKVTFIYRQAGGGKSAPITVTSKKMPNGKFFAVHNQVVDIKKAMNTKYMVEVVGKGIISDWENLNVPCKIGLGGNGGLANPPAIPFKVLSAQLGIKGPKTKVCPNKAMVMAWFKTNKPGNVGFRLMRGDGPVGPMIFVPSVKSASGYMASYSRTISIINSINTTYSAVVPGQGGLASNFVPLKASCAVGLPGGLAKKP
jgi:hypothetical protein